MLDYLERHPVVRFFGEVLGMAFGAAILVIVAGWIWRWSNRTDYSDGFFIACVVLAAIASSRAVMYHPAYHKKGAEPANIALDSNLSGAALFLAKRSFNFRMLMAALLCLAISILIAQ